MTQRDDFDHPLDYPETAEIARERARRIAAIAAQCGEIIPRGALEQPASSPIEEEVLVRDDVDAATRFFDAVDEAPVDAEEDAASERAGATTYDFSRYRARRIRERLLGLLDALHLAIERRDLGAVWTVLDEADACRCFPPAVREEALALAQLPSTAYRAPLRLYRYHHLLIKLADEPLELAVDPAQLTIDDVPMESSARPASPPVRELQFPGPRSPDHDPHRGGSDRRRSGAR